MDDMQLLREYTLRGSQEAFAQLVGRHINWVYALCCRMMKDRTAAQDVTQAVFIVLARKAGELSEETVIAGWLVNTARYAVADARKRQNRRERRERQAGLYAGQKATQPTDAADHEELLASVDQAMMRLRPADRDALVLRFYEQLSLEQVGASLGISEEAARKRVARALAKLRSILRVPKRTLPAAALGSLLLATATQAAPLELQSSAVTAATSGGAGTAAGIARGAMELMAWAKIKLAGSLVGLSVVVVSAAWIPVTSLAQRRPPPPIVAVNPAPAPTPGVAAPPPSAAMTPRAPEAPADDSFILHAGPEFSQKIDRRLLRFRHDEGTFKTFHLVVSVMALPGRGNVQADVVVERQAQSTAVLVRSTQAGLPYAYLSDGLYVGLDLEHPGGLVVSERLAPLVTLGPRQTPGATLTDLRVEAGERRTIDIDLAGLIEGLQEGATGRSFNARLHSVSLSRETAGGRVRLAAQALPDQPPVLDFNVSETARLAVTVHHLRVDALAATLPRITLAQVEQLGLPVRRIAIHDVAADLLPAAGFFDQPQQCAAATKLRTLLVPPNTP
jgi:RNA polymerase sigma factor (sigma-70 family)